VNKVEAVVSEWAIGWTRLVSYSLSRRYWNKIMNQGYDALYPRVSVFWLDWTDGTFFLYICNKVLTDYLAR